MTDKVRCRYAKGYWIKWTYGRCRHKTTHPSGYCWRHRLNAMGNDY